MECLKDYIGLLECNRVSDPGSGQYINSLPGFSTEILQKISSPEQATYDKVWDSVQKMAGLRFYSDAIAKLRKEYKLRQVRTQIEFIPEDSGGIESYSALYYRGLRIRFDEQSYSFQSITISEILYFSNVATVTVVFRITDKYENVLFEKQVSTVIGLNRIRVDKIFPVDELRIGIYGLETENVPITEFSEGVLDDFCGACTMWGCDPIVEGFTKLDAQDLVTTGRSTHGIGFIGHLGCSYQSLICNHKELFLTPWMFLLGNQMMINILSSQRNNQFTTVDRQKYEELRDFYSLEYEKALENSLSGYLVNTEDDCCIECNENPKSVEWLP